MAPKQVYHASPQLRRKLWLKEASIRRHPFQHAH
jgi:hypothetical protein